MSNVWIVYGQTESGDDWMMCFGFKPSDTDIVNEIMKDDWLRDEYDAGCISGWTITNHNIVEEAA